jgi:inosine/xanthosine triphosphatase
VSPPGALTGLRRVLVGSTNPPKLEGVRSALAAFAPHASVSGVPVASGVPEQPVGFAEIAAGARQRAAEARAIAPCDLAVGYEDGLVEIPALRGWFNVGCAAVDDGRRVHLGLSSGFAYPPACSSAAVAGRSPIGELFDRFWHEHRDETRSGASALSVGNVGKLTAGELPRSDYTRQAVLCALIALLHPDLYGTAGAPR